MGKYDDIINLPRPVSKKRKPMSIYDRAAQFSPFSALTGFEGAIKETARRTEKKIELDECSKRIINDRLQFIYQNAGEKVKIHLRFFEKDIIKEGGRYVDKEGYLRKLDIHNNSVILDDGSVVLIEDIQCLDIIKGEDEHE